MKEPRLGLAAAGFGICDFVSLKPEASDVDPAPAIRDQVRYLGPYDDVCDRLCDDDDQDL
jgi:hypothetical protein